MASSEPSTTHPPASESAYHDLRRLIPSLASELDGLRTSLREHNRWIQRYGHTSSSSSSSVAAPPADPTPSPSLPTAPAPTSTELPAYSAPDVPPYTPDTAQEVIERRDQITEWLREGEDVLREYSARFAQVGRELGMPFDDVLGTWIEGEPGNDVGDNALPDYEVIERREELMIGGVGEVPPPYTGGEAPKQAPDR